MNQPAGSASPLVSIIVRSMGRPLLGDAVESILRQDYAPIEVVVVDATGGRHPPLPDAWVARGVRLVELGRPLPRPQAANAGLDAARGAMLGFLDDDDTYDANHVSLLMRHYNAMKPLQVMYAGARVLDGDGRVDRLMHHPYNPIMLMVNMYIQTGAALGTSGMGVGGNIDETSSEPMVGRVMAKWAGRREALWMPVQELLADARRALASGDRARARILSDQIFEKYPIRFALEPVEGGEAR